MAKTQTPAVQTGPAQTAADDGPKLGWSISGYRLVNKQSEWSPKSGAYTRKRVGSVIIKTADGLQFPAEAAVIFPKDTAQKPKCIVSGPAIRYEGPLFTPSDELSKADREQLAHQIATFEAQAAASFVTWYRKQQNVPELTARVTGAPTTGVDLE